jgi:tetratricopeptide (TPR) repeat protein
MVAMAKQKKPSKQQLEKDLEKLYDFMDQQNFQSIEELQAFMDQMTGRKIDEIVPRKKGPKNKKEQSAELLDDAYETPAPAKARKLARRAVELDPDNADAYIFLADLESDPAKALSYYEQAMAAGRRRIGEEDFQEMKGHFWGIHETRPFMRAKAGYAGCLYLLGRHDESITQYEEMIELNPGDNQGVRYFFASLLVQLGKWEAYEALARQYQDEGSAMWLYTYAISVFKREGASARAEQALKRAFQANQHVVGFLLGGKPLPDMLPDHYGWGDENEAVLYLDQAGLLWIETTGALEWVRDASEHWKTIN